MSETLIKKKIIYSTEHNTELNLMKTKTKEATFSDLILGTEESNNDTTEAHGKKTPTM